MRAYDLSPLYRSTVGFDRLASMLDSVARVDAAAPSYPPYNIERTGEDHYRISMAVAGFGESDLNVEQTEETLVISGRKQEKEDGNYLHRGIATRDFERRFQLADHVKVTNAALQDGLLHIDLVREIPEEKQPRRITISNGDTKVIEGTTKDAA